MYFSEIYLDSFKVFIHSKKESPHYTIHRIVWDLFPNSEESERDFLFRLDFVKNRQRLLLLSEKEPKIAPWCSELNSKIFAPRIFEGQSIRVKLRVNPIVRGKSDRKRHDVVMHHKKLHPEQNTPSQELIQEAIFNWFEMRIKKNGASLSRDCFKVDSYQQMDVTDGKRNIKFSIADITANLVVSDVIKFIDLVKEGIGGSKSLGCGLLILGKPGL